MTTVTGRARRLGDHINTDYIISSARKRETLDETQLRRYLLEAIDPGFAATVRDDDLLVAGRNFGCGSAMEVAATVILAAGIRAVVASSLSRSFYRNAINNGLVPIVADTAAIAEGDRLVITLDDAGVLVVDDTTGARVSGPAIPETMRAILQAGGLVPYLRARGRF